MRRRPALRAFHQARQDLLVARAPDQARTQGDRGQVRPIGGEHRLLGDGLGFGIGRLEILAIGNIVGGAAFDRMGGAMGHAGRGGVDQLADAVDAAGIEHVLRADDIGRVIAFVAAPGAGLGRVVEDRFHAIGGMGQRMRIGQVALHLAHAELRQHRIVPAIEADDLVAAFDQAAAQRLAEESTAAGDQDLHALLPN